MRPAALRALLILGLLLLGACSNPPAPPPSPSQEPAVQPPPLRPRSLLSSSSPSSAPLPTAVRTPATPAAAETPPAPEAEVTADTSTASLAASTPDTSGFVQVVVGENHACALQRDGRVHCWGGGNDGQLEVPEGMTFKEITAGYRFTCGIRTDGAIACWGQNKHQKLDPPPGAFTAIDAGWDHVCALRDTVAKCWGWNANDRATAPSTPLTDVGSGAEHSCGLTVSGDLTCWGANVDGRADSRPGPFQALAVGVAHTCVLRSDHSVLCQGDNSSGQSEPPPDSFRFISAGSDHTCGILLTDAIACWGYNSHDALNIRLDSPRGRFTTLGAGWTRTCAVNPSGVAQCWGYRHKTLSVEPFDRLNFRNAFPGFNFSQPVEIIPWPDGGMAVVKRTGSLSIHRGGAEPETILDLSDTVDLRSVESGLLSAAIDPDSIEAPFIYVYYTLRDVEGQPDSSGREPAIARLSRFPIFNGKAISEQELVILELPRPTPSLLHFGGSIRFGPDGHLYLGVGDAECSACPQDLTSLHGKILRIDVSGAHSERPYKVPDDNPFVGNQDARPEIWALGLRNPWRMAFDAESGSLWLGDVGASSREEISLVNKGSNLGWPTFEGNECVTNGHQSTESKGNSDVAKACRDFNEATPPLITYGHQPGCAVVGGVVYRGSQIPWLNGVYLFADFCDGTIWVLDGNAESGWRLIQIADLSYPVSSFGVDDTGEVFVLTFGGPIVRLVEAETGLSPRVSVFRSETIEPVEKAAP